MLPTGALFGRVISSDLAFVPITKFICIGDDLKFWIYEDKAKQQPSGFTLRNRQAFGDGTTELLSKLKVAVIGCSGLGSPTIEQLLRLGVGELVLIDHESIGEENINRIYSSSISNVGVKKVQFFKDLINSYNLGIKVTVLDGDICRSKVILKYISTCDFIIGCIDGFLPRDTLNRLSTFYLVPYLDLAVGLESDGIGGVNSIIGWIRYLVPGKSSLLSRNMYDSKDLEREAFEKYNHEEFKARENQKYLKGAKVGRPAVISVNTTVSGLAVNDFLSRIHHLRFKGNHSYPGFCIDLCEWKIEPERVYPTCKALIRYVGRGDMSPFLDMVGIEITNEAA